MDRPRILIVEDEMIIAEDLKDILEDLGYNVCGIAISAREAMQFLEEQKVDLALLDIKIKGGKDGIDLALDAPKIFIVSCNSSALFVAFALSKKRRTEIVVYY